ncbi:hypothetical protein PSTG_05288 [Puccinia striiformis f. sp. tritici PST-78]|uniref:Uncharacterized protein n=1 Tax=Puccinia striiformis f. sp. tritici PST-78 TaxID=1165861 RepID=A0A0L0VQG0_9BASI|nr:hypothetical protein PSTG_05288 [Puccinia striiformis f. sp. tritici PST-78]
MESKFGARSSSENCWNLTSEASSSERTLSSPLHEPSSKKPHAVGKDDDVTDVITNQDQLRVFYKDLNLEARISCSNQQLLLTFLSRSLTATDINNKNSNLLDQIFPPITDSNIGYHELILSKSNYLQLKLL